MVKFTTCTLEVAIVHDLQIVEQVPGENRSRSSWGSGSRPAEELSGSSRGAHSLAIVDIDSTTYFKK